MDTCCTAVSYIACLSFWGTFPYFFKGQKPKSLQWGLWSFILFWKPKLWHAQRKIREIVTDRPICGVEASLMEGGGWTLLFAGPSLFFQGPKNEIFTIAPLGTFFFVNANFQKPAGRDWENYWGYMSYWWFSLTHVLVFGDAPQFLQGQKRQFWATFSTRFGIGGFLFHN